MREKNEHKIINIDFVEKQKIGAEEFAVKEKDLTKKEECEKDLDERDGNLRLTRFQSSDGGQKLLGVIVPISEISESRLLIKGYSVLELFGFLEGADGGDLKRRPAFYQGIYYEIKNRLESSK